MATNPNNDNMDRVLGAGGGLAEDLSAEEIVALDATPTMGDDGSIVTELADGSVEIGYADEDEGFDIPFTGNLAEVLEERTLGEMSQTLLAEYEQNKTSREDWEKTYTKGLDLLGYKQEEVTEPFVGACSLTHPLLAESATQFQAQAFNELLPAKGPVKPSVFGKRRPELLNQAVRVANFMNYYIMEVMKEYSPEFDQLLFQLALAGSAFKKVYYDAGLNRVTSQYVPAENLVVPYQTSSLSTCPHAAQLVPMAENDVKKLQLKGFYRKDVEVTAGAIPVSSPVKDAKDEIEGKQETGAGSYEVNLIEFHVELEIKGLEHLDEEGQVTGLKQPYIVTVVEDTGDVLSVYRNWREEDPEFTRKDYFVHYKFLPGLGFYGFGLTHAIGNMADAAGGILRSLVDAGTFANLPAGYKASGIRVANSKEPLVPGEFRDIDVPSGKVSDVMMPLPFKGPNQTLYALLGFVVEAGQRFATITDMKVGEGDQQAPVGTTLALLEEGNRIMSAVHKRMHGAMKEEFKLMAQAISEQKGLEYPYEVEEGASLQQDFDGRVDVVPVSDPNIFSMTQRISLAQAQLQLAKEAPHLHSEYEAYRRMYEALGTTDIDALLKPPPTQEPQPTDPAQEHIDALNGLPLKAFDGQDYQAHIESHLMFSASPVAAQAPGVLVALQKHVTEHVKIAAEETAVAEWQKDRGPHAQPTEDDKLEIEIAIAQKVAEGLRQVRKKAIEISQETQPHEDPVVDLKQQEIDQEKREFEKEQQLEYSKLQQRETQFQERLQSTEKITQDRLDMQEHLAKMKQRTERTNRNTSVS